MGRLDTLGIHCGGEVGEGWTDNPFLLFHKDEVHSTWVEQAVSGIRDSDVLSLSIDSLFKSKVDFLVRALKGVLEAGDNYWDSSGDWSIHELNVESGSRSVGKRELVETTGR